MCLSLCSVDIWNMLVVEESFPLVCVCVCKLLLLLFLHVSWHADKCVCVCVCMCVFWTISTEFFGGSSLMLFTNYCFFLNCTSRAKLHWSFFWFSDGEPVVLGSNVDGYIPMKFSAGSHLKVTGIPIKYSPQFVHKTSHKEADKLWSQKVPCLL